MPLKLHSLCPAPQTILTASRPCSLVASYRSLQHLEVREPVDLVVNLNVWVVRRRDTLIHQRLGGGEGKVESNKSEGR